MKDNKDQGESKLDPAEIKLTVSSPFLKKLENFWYHHKWKVIVIAFFAIVVTVCILQMVNREDVDDTVIIAVPDYLSAEEINEIDNVMSSMMPANAKGEKNLVVQFYPIFSEDEMLACEQETDEEGYYLYVDPSYNTQRFGEYNDYLKTGASTLLFVSPYLYEQQRMYDRVLPLSEVFGEKLPLGALPDGCGVRLGDTYAYSFFEALQVLPENTVVCLLRKPALGIASKEEQYERTKELFKSILNFGN